MMSDEWPPINERHIADISRIKELEDEVDNLRRGNRNMREGLENAAKRMDTAEQENQRLRMLINWCAEELKMQIKYDSPVSSNCAREIIAILSKEVGDG